MKITTTILTFLVCIYAGTAVGQTDPDPQAKATDKKDQEQPMEEITVIGQKSMGTLRVQIDRAEDRIFDIFNELNTDDLYDIHCRKVALTGSRLRRKTCAPEYFDRTEADMTFLRSVGVLVGADYMDVRLVRYNKIMGEKWGQLAKTNPDLLQAIKEHYELSEELKSQRREYFGLDK